jgi:hypothetical protein
VYGLGGHAPALPQNIWKMVKFTIYMRGKHDFRLIGKWSSARTSAVASGQPLRADWDKHC